MVSAWNVSSRHHLAMPGAMGIVRPRVPGPPLAEMQAAMVDPREMADGKKRGGAAWSTALREGLLGRDQRITLISSGRAPRILFPSLIAFL